jgi:hypothetical protein
MKKMFNNNSTNSKDSEQDNQYYLENSKDSKQENNNQEKISKDSEKDNNNQNNSIISKDSKHDNTYQYNLDDNIFYRIKNLLDKDEKQLLTDDDRKLFKNQHTRDEKQHTNWISKRKDKKQLIKKRKQVITDIKKQFVEKYVIPSLKDTEKQNKDIEKQDKNVEKQDNNNTIEIIEKPSNKSLGASGEAIEEIIIKVNKKISYNTKLSNNGYSNWILVNQEDKNTCILYNEYESELPELRIYIFNMEFKKIQLQHCYDIEFLTCAIKYYYNIKLDTLEIEKIAKHTENGSLKVQWIDYLLNNEYDFLVHYGEILLKLAIKQKNTELMEKIIKKTLEYFKKDLKRNIYILSIIFNNVPYLELNYVENLLKYYNETTLFLDSSNHKVNNFDHLHSFCIELRKSGKMHRIIKWFFIFITPVLCAIAIWNFLKGKDTKSFVPIFILVFIINISNLYNFITLYRKSYNLKLLFVVPFPNYVKYSKDYNWFKEFFIIPKSSPFSKTENNEFYKTWNGEAIINFKWRVFGRYYYAVIWFLFMIFLISFTLASSVSSEIIKDKYKRNLLISSIIFGSLHLFFEIRQFIWNPIKWIVNPWNWFGMYEFFLTIIYIIKNFYLFLS